LFVLFLWVGGMLFKKLGRFCSMFTKRRLEKERDVREAHDVSVSSSESRGKAQRMPETEDSLPYSDGS